MIHHYFNFHCSACDKDSSWTNYGDSTLRLGLMTPDQQASALVDGYGSSGPITGAQHLAEQRIHSVTQDETGWTVIRACKDCGAMLEAAETRLNITRRNSA